MKKKEVATIILNRNLKSITDKLYKKIFKYNKNHTDIYVVDSGSDKKKNHHLLLGPQTGNLLKKMVYDLVEA